MARLLFVLHEASRTGAPFTQLHLMRWLKQHTQHKMLILLLKGGALEPEFAEVAQVHVVHPPYVPGQSLQIRAWNRLGQFYRSHEDRALAIARAFQADLIFANTAVALSYAATLKQQLRLPLISSLHELEITFYYCSATEFRRAAEQVDAFMMGSEAVQQYYIQQFEVEPARTHLIYDFTGPVPAQLTPPAQDIRARYGLEPGTLLVGGMATLIWRKGPELFLTVAQQVAQQLPNVHFIWVGGDPKSATYQELQRDVRLLGLQDRVTLAGNQADIASYYAAFDVFLLTSREDPFPLVCLEAALYETPVLCFANSGGMPEFVRDDAGVVVPYLDTAAMAANTIALLQDERRRLQLGRTARQRVLDEHTIEAVGPAILHLIESTLSTSSAG
ncbi:glycosyltransferase family 4 protein [Hymenobacter metallilatus]|uniref:Glycosyltransferase family 1 protein n=1 Tax=Hymenobacter metallilatus TaxID=2493666 RepID=A0A428JR54_9BACT|nr:glycosyltransferase family 4 protein [Hymenobacter metallilatus]RSK36044.1 glycosyltransferase family 1 protein [Hymenobacter metallilatus]